MTSQPFHYSTQQISAWAGDGGEAAAGVGTAPRGAWARDGGEATAMAGEERAWAGDGGEAATWKW
jgi:hypothetical protein